MIRNPKWNDGKIFYHLLLFFMLFLFPENLTFFIGLVLIQILYEIRKLVFEKENSEID